MSLYNVAEAVVAVVEADSPEDAQAQLAQALREAGFEVYPHESAPSLDPFLSELSTEPSGLPS